MVPNKRRPAPSALRTARLSRAHLGSWIEIYSDPVVQHQMYAAPTRSRAALWAYLRRRTVFTVLEGSTVIGGFNFYDEHDTRASFGIVLHPRFRGKGLGRELVRLMKDKARELGYTTLRADVYKDNAACLALVAKEGFREFTWVETNL